MEGKLKKLNDTWYKLFSANGSVKASTKIFPGGKLSLKNCQAIENVYDLDELASEFANDKSSSDVFKEVHKKDFIAGFETAVEILGDKKFNEEDIRRALSTGLSIGYGRQFEIENKQLEIDSYMNSLHQTEWDCTFNTDEKDSDGCLILRRK